MNAVNHGVIPGIKQSDWVAGTIQYEVRNPSGDWRPYLVRGEKQHSNVVDNMDCVAEATNNVGEIQIKQQTGQEVNFSDRFLAKMSGTTTQGNWVYIVLDTWRKIGCVLEEEWPRPPSPNYTWNDYYASIPQFIVDRAPSQSIHKYDLQYEVVGNTADAIRYHLKHAPLMVTLPGHEVAGVVLSADNKTLTYLDSYDPFIKTRPISDIDWIYKAVLTVKQTNHMQLVNDNGTYFLVGDKGKLGIADPDSLAKIKQLTAQETTGTTAGIPQVGTLTHNDAFVIHS